VGRRISGTNSTTDYAELFEPSVGTDLLKRIAANIFAFASMQNFIMVILCSPEVTHPFIGFATSNLFEVTITYVACGHEQCVPVDEDTVEEPVDLFEEAEDMGFICLPVVEVSPVLVHILVGGKRKVVEAQRCFLIS
jgi:hypothetical protein